MINLDYLKFFLGWPPELAVLLISMIPIAELRVSLPLALTAYAFSWPKAFVICVVGNMIPVFFIVKLIGPVSEYLRANSKIADKFFLWLFQRTRNKTVKHYEKYGLWALMLFVAIPLPMTGAWTGALAAWLFGVKTKPSLIYIGLGVIIAGLIVSVVTLGAKTIWFLI